MAPRDLLVPFSKLNIALGGSLMGPSKDPGIRMTGKDNPTIKLEKENEMDNNSNNHVVW